MFIPDAILNGATKEEMIGGVEIATIAENEEKENVKVAELVESEEVEEKPIGPEFLQVQKRFKVFTYVEKERKKLQDDPLPDVLLRVRERLETPTPTEEECEVMMAVAAAGAGDSPTKGKVEYKYHINFRTVKYYFLD